MSKGTVVASSQSTGPGKHSILLLQQTASLETRTYCDHESVAAAIDHILFVFEEKMRAKHHGNPFTYESTDLFQYVDSLHDVSLLVFEKNIRAYVPYDRKWIKDKLYLMLANQRR